MEYWRPIGMSAPVEEREIAMRDETVVDTVIGALPLHRRRWCVECNAPCGRCARGIVTRDEWMAWLIRDRFSVQASG